MNEFNEQVRATIDALNKADKESAPKDPKKKRETVKTVLIIFLVLMLVLTFFSNTIMNKSLPQVTTESTSSGKLTERVRGSGIIEANQVYDVTVEGNRVVDSISVKAGQTVAEGDVLFTVGSKESPELIEAQSALEAMQLEYDKMLLAVSADYSAEEQAIKNAREDLNEAIKKRDAAAVAEQADRNVQNAYNSNKIKLSSNMEKQTKLTDAISAIDSDNYTGAPVEYIGSLPSLYSAYTQAQSDYDSAYALYSQVVADGKDASSAKADADAKESARNEAQNAYNKEKSKLRSGLAEQLSVVSAAVEQLTAAVSEYENSSGGGASFEELKASVIEKQRALQDLIISLDLTKKNDSAAAQIAGLELKEKKNQIDMQTKRVNELLADCGITEVKAELGGVVSAVNIRPKEVTVPDTPLVSIDIDTAGYTVKVVVDADAAAKVAPNAKADMVNNWSGDVQAVLTDIRADTTGNSKNRVLVFSLTGDLDSGTYADLSIDCGSGNYQVIVPKSAVHEDSNGQFVLTVKSKSSPLGNRYYAQRINVSVLASDETSSAVMGEIQYGDYVITASSKPIQPNDQVRMKDV